MFGRARLNLGGGPAWHWRENLLTIALPAEDRTGPAAPVPVDTSWVPDAPVRLRRGNRRLGDRLQDETR